LIFGTSENMLILSHKKELDLDISFLVYSRRDITNHPIIQDFQDVLNLEDSNGQKDI
jgi:hypothetical protein